MIINIGVDVMVKGLKVLVLVVSVLLVVGCMDYKFGMSINQDKSVDIEMSMEMDMLDFMNNMLEEDGMWSKIQEQIITSTCSSMCPYDESSSEYTTCMNECANNAGDTTTTEVPTEEEIREYLDSYFSSGEFNEEEFLSDEERAELESMGYTVETNLDEKNYVYSIHISQHFDNIDDITSDNLIEVNLEEVFNGGGNNLFFSRTDDGNYQANYVWKVSDEDVSYEDVDISEFLTVSYEISLPYASISNNATTVSEDGRTLTWDLMNSDTINYEFSFDSPEDTTNNGDTSISNSNDDIIKIVSICLIAGGVIGLIIVFIILFKNRKK